MIDEGKMALAAAPRRSTDRRFPILLMAVGIAATLSLLLVPLEALVPAGLSYGPIELRLLALINPLILLTLAVVGGGWAAPKVGLDAPYLRAIAERRPIPAVRPMLAPSLAVGIAVALVIAIYSTTIGAALSTGPMANLKVPLVTRLLYGGITEEILTRWGLMSLLALAAAKLVGPGRERAAIWGALITAALIFAAGHLPLLFLLSAAPTPAMIGGVVLGNAIPGMMFGWLYWRYGLEAAMLGHGSAHFIAWATGVF